MEKKNTTIVTSLEKYAFEVRRLTKNKVGCIFRGQARETWLPESAASRRVREAIEKSGRKKDFNFQEEYVRYHEELIDDARKRGHGHNEHSRILTDLEILAQLQHHGAATAFIDFSKNLYVALWFAVRSEEDYNSQVLVVTDANMKFDQITEDYFMQQEQRQEQQPDQEPQQNYSPEKIANFLDPNVRNSMWEAHRIRDERIVRQSSVFVFGDPEISKNDYKTITIRKDSKAAIKAELDNLHDINDKTMFPDMPGFADANSVSKPYKLKSKLELAADHRYRGIDCYEKGEYEQAIDNLTNAIDIKIDSSEHLESYRYRGLSHHDLNNYDQAIADFTKAIEIDPKDAEAYSRRGFSYLDKLNFDSAIADFNEAIKINSQYAEAYLFRGMSHYAQNNHGEAIADFTEALEHDSTDDVARAAYVWRGSSYVIQGDHDKAIADFTALIKINSQDTEIYNSRGFSYLVKQNFDSAIADFTEAIKINPQYVDAYKNRGLSYRAQGKHDLAIADFKKVIEINQLNNQQSDAMIYIQLGKAYESSGNHNEADKAFTKAIDIDPQYALAYFARGMARCNNSKQQGWDEDLRTALHLAKEQGDADLEKRIRQAMREFGISDSDE